MLTWKDGLVSAVAIGEVAYFYTVWRGNALPLSSNPRLLIGLLLVLGVITCAMGGRDVNQIGSNPWMLTTMVLVGVAVATGIYGLITGSMSAAYWLAGALALAWLVTTARHIAQA